MAFPFPVSLKLIDAFVKSQILMLSSKVRNIGFCHAALVEA